MNNADIGIARIALDDNRESGDLVVVFSRKKQNLRIEGEAMYGGLPEQVEGRGTSEQFESALSVGEFEVPEYEDLEQMEDAGHQDAVPRGGFFEMRSGEQSRGDDDIDMVFQGGDKRLEFIDRDGQIRIEEQYRVIDTLENASADSGTFAAVFLE